MVNQEQSHFISQTIALSHIARKFPETTFNLAFPLDSDDPEYAEKLEQLTLLPKNVHIKSFKNTD